MNYFNVKSQLYAAGIECRKAREAEGVSQAEVAKELGMTKQNISLFELGKISNLKIYMYYKERFSHGAEKH